MTSPILIIQKYFTRKPNLPAFNFWVNGGGWRCVFWGRRFPVDWLAGGCVQNGWHFPFSFFLIWIIKGFLLFGLSIKFPYSFFLFLVPFPPLWANAEWECDWRHFTFCMLYMKLIYKCVCLLYKCVYICVFTI
jgi:hypothetical protein